MDDGRVRETAETAGCGADDGRDCEEFRLTENERLDCDELGQEVTVRATVQLQLVLLPAGMN